MQTLPLRAAAALAGFLAATGLVFAHGNVTPQAMNTDSLPDIGEEWLSENPYRGAEPAVFEAVLAVGDSGFNQNCARCHGLGAISGGVAPDLRHLEAEEYGDAWFVERFRHGYTQNGVTKMPAFGDLLGQKAGWAIRTYVETRPDDDSMKTYAAELHRIRDELADWSGDEAQLAAVKARLEAIAADIKTFSGAPVADSVARRAAIELGGANPSPTHAAETLSIGLSAAK
jgi:cytochrome c-550 PedF